MGEFALFIFIIFSAVWGSIALGSYMFGRDKLTGGSDEDSDLLLQAVREELDAVSTRLMRVEDDLSFFNELHAPERKPALSPPASTASDDAE